VDVGVKVGIRLPWAVHGQGVGAYPAPQGRRQVAEAEVREADFGVLFFAGELVVFTKARPAPCNETRPTAPAGALGYRSVARTERMVREACNAGSSWPTPVLAYSRNCSRSVPRHAARV
jgi:hypothetical protein